MILSSRLHRNGALSETYEPMIYPKQDNPEQVKPQGPYTLWRNHGYDGWSCEDHPTLEAALSADKITDVWIIMTPVEHENTNGTPQD